MSPTDAERLGRVEALAWCPESGRPMERAERLRVTREGIVGDRYRADTGRGFWMGKGDSALTLVDAESVEAVGRLLGQTLDPVKLRRNVVTRGVDLDALIGSRFRIGDVVLEGERRCDPCMRLERHLGLPGLKGALKDRGGLRAIIVGEGALHVGDDILLQM